jgi:hypothetical protein
VTIAFRLPHRPPSGSRSYSPALEAVLSLHVRRAQAPPAAAWLGAGDAAAPPALKREIDTLAFAYRAYFPEFFFPSPDGSLLSFGDELAALRGLEPALVQREYAIPFVGDGPIDPLRVRPRSWTTLWPCTSACLRCWRPTGRRRSPRNGTGSTGPRCLGRRGRTPDRDGRRLRALRGLFPEVRCDPSEGGSGSSGRTITR